MALQSNYSLVERKINLMTVVLVFYCLMTIPAVLKEDAYLLFGMKTLIFEIDL